MSKRKLNLQDECLASFSKALKKDIKENLKVYKQVNVKMAKSQEMAYSSVIFLLKQKATEYGIALSDLGLEDYDVPTIEEDFGI